jgi:gliding motility-associated protein GldM
MAGYKETPRQKMIGMMYLVLTALLALNVSKEILEAFIVVNESIETTNENFTKKLDKTFADFKIQYQLNPNKVGPYWEKAQVAKKLTDKLVKYVDSIKYVALMRTDRLPSLEDAKKTPIRDAKRKDNYDLPTRYLCGSSHDGSSGEARILKEKIETYKKQMLELVDPKYRNTIKTGLDTKGPFYDRDGNEQSWEMHNFYRTILVADFTILNRIIAEVHNTNFDVMNYLLSSISAEDFKYDKIDARVIPKKSYVFLGEDYDAEIVVAAFDTKADPNVRYALGADTLLPRNFNSATALTAEKGVVRLKIPGSSEGLKKFAGIIKIVSPLGDTMTFHFKDEFIVAKPGLTISPSKMNVFYVGVENPVDILVPGSPEKIVPTISIGKIRPEGKNWMVYDLPKGVRDATINVTAVFSGKSKPMGATTFRLKPVPDPIAKVGGKNEGFISKSLLLASPYLLAEMPVGFDFDLKFSVVSFSFVTNVGGDIIPTKVTGNRLPPDILKIIQNAKKNSRIWFEEITVKGPDGERSIPGIGLKIN